VEGVPANRGKEVVQQDEFVVANALEEFGCEEFPEVFLHCGALMWFALRQMTQCHAKAEFVERGGVEAVGGGVVPEPEQCFARQVGDVVSLWPDGVVVKVGAE
jgi:hypothetical protein